MAEDGPSERSDRRGKAREGDASTTSNGAVRGAGQLLASTLRSSMASAQLGSVLNSAAGGSKEEFRQAAHSTSDQGLREWLTQNLKSHASSSSSASQRVQATPTSFRSELQQTATQADDFTAFERGMAQPQQPARRNHIASSNNVDWRRTGLDPYQPVVPIASYTDLDARLHDTVRAHTEPRPSRSDSVRQMAPTAPPSDDIFALLDEEEQLSSAFGSRVEIASSTDPEVAADVLQNFAPVYRPPSPSNSGFSAEQAAMHIALAEAQAAEQGKQELLVPRPDNAEAHEGVYALTAQDALRSVFEGRTESSAQTSTEHTQDPATVVVRKITQFFTTSTYIDDVYGLPPLLRETIDEATRKDESANEESRQKAIRRLESLWNHITNTPPPQSTQWVDAWLRTNT